MLVPTSASGLAPDVRAGSSPSDGLRSGPVIVMPRRIPGGVAASLDALPAEALPRLNFQGPVAALRRRLRCAITERMPRPRWLANWLLDDVLDKAALVVASTGAPALRVVLGAGEPNSDDGFEVTASSLRLVTSYRSAGIEWVQPRTASLSRPVEVPPSATPRRLARGDVAMLRGLAADDSPGVLDRAGVAGGTDAPLRLTIDAAGRIDTVLGALQ